MSTTTYLPLVIVVALAAFFTTVWVVQRYVQPLNNLLLGKTFDCAARSLYGLQSTYFLLLLRIGAFFFFLLGSQSWIYMISGTTQYTDWNICLITWYYLVSATSTAMYCLAKKDFRFAKEFVSRYGEILGGISGTFFVVMLSNALLVTSVDFTLLDSGLYFANLAIHLFNSVFAILDFCLNSVYVQPSDILFVLTWLYLYLTYIWVAVIAGVIEFPYGFLDCSSPIAVLVYLGLLLVLYVFFLLVWKLSSYCKNHHLEKELGAFLLQGEESQVDHPNMDTSVFDV